MKKQDGFTLIELLVVISIIALLLSILLPSLRAAREQAGKVICMTRMRGIGTAVLLYAQENDGKLPQPNEKSFTGGKFDSGRKDLGLESATGYYSYHGDSFDGASGIGYLYNAGFLINTDGKQAYCPSVTDFFGKKMPKNGWDSNGNPDHENWIGNTALGGTSNFVHNMNVDWFNQRTTIGTRKLGHVVGNRRYGIFKIENAAMRGKRAFLSDVWASLRVASNYWRTAYDDVAHKSGGKRSMNVWYIDGHAQNVKISEGRFKEDFSNGKKYLDENSTWSNMFDNAN